MIHNVDNTVIKGDGSDNYNNMNNSDIFQTRLTVYLEYFENILRIYWECHGTVLKVLWEYIENADEIA